MARFRPPSSKNRAQTKNIRKTARGLVPCVVILIAGMAVIFFMFFELMNSGK
jgi:hypothetical protein